MATSLTGPPLALTALKTAPVPRPPQPTMAIWMVLLSAACTNGIATPARLEAAATTPAVLITSRRDRPLFSVVFTECPLSVGESQKRQGSFIGTRIFHRSQSLNR